MRERIYTIPVNEAFEQSEKGCPFCLLYNRLESTELELILGASMMEPDIRRETNKKGFCKTHYEAMFDMKNRLGLALMLESHLQELLGRLKFGKLYSKNIAAKPISAIEKLDRDCYVCDRIEDKMSKMFSTTVYLYHTEPEFVTKFGSQTMFCLPHYKQLLDTGFKEMDKKGYRVLANHADKIVWGYLSELKGDVSWFCKKFDYRFGDEPWGNSKDAVERSIRFLSGPADLG